jgi:hypothetical protein
MTHCLGSNLYVRIPFGRHAPGKMHADALLECSVCRAAMLADWWACGRTGGYGNHEEYQMPAHNAATAGLSATGAGDG